MLRHRGRPTLPGLDAVRFGPFVTRLVFRRPDGSLVVGSSRRHRKGLGLLPAGARPARTGRPARVRELNWWIAVLFMIGSALFALGSFPGLSSVAPARLLGLSFFAGSIFFTFAAYVQYL